MNQELRDLLTEIETPVVSTDDNDLLSLAEEVKKEKPKIRKLAQYDPKALKTSLEGYFAENRYNDQRFVRDTRGKPWDSKDTPAWGVPKELEHSVVRGAIGLGEGLFALPDSENPRGEKPKHGGIWDNLRWYAGKFGPAHFTMSGLETIGEVVSGLYMITTGAVVGAGEGLVKLIGNMGANRIPGWENVDTSTYHAMGNWIQNKLLPYEKKRAYASIIATLLSDDVNAINVILDRHLGETEWSIHPKLQGMEHPATILGKRSTDKEYTESDIAKVVTDLTEQYEAIKMSPEDWEAANALWEGITGHYTSAEKLEEKMRSDPAEVLLDLFDIWEVTTGFKTFGKMAQAAGKTLPPPRGMTPGGPAPDAPFKDQLGIDQAARKIETPLPTPEEQMAFPMGQELTDTVTSPLTEISKPDRAKPTPIPDMPAFAGGRAPIPEQARRVAEAQRNIEDIPSEQLELLRMEAAPDEEFPWTPEEIDTELARRADDFDFEDDIRSETPETSNVSRRSYLDTLVDGVRSGEADLSNIDENQLREIYTDALEMGDTELVNQINPEIDRRITQETRNRERMTQQAREERIAELQTDLGNARQGNFEPPREGMTQDEVVSDLERSIGDIENADDEQLRMLLSLDDQGDPRTSEIARLRRGEADYIAEQPIETAPERFTTDMTELEDLRETRGNEPPSYREQSLAYDLATHLAAQQNPELAGSLQSARVFPEIEGIIQGAYQESGDINRAAEAILSWFEEGNQLQDAEVRGVGVIGDTIPRAELTGRTIHTDDIDALFDEMLGNSADEARVTPDEGQQILEAIEDTDDLISTIDNIIDDPEAGAIDLELLTLGTPKVIAFLKRFVARLREVVHNFIRDESGGFNTDELDTLLQNARAKRTPFDRVETTGLDARTDLKTVRKAYNFEDTATYPDPNSILDRMKAIEQEVNVLDMNDVQGAQRLLDELQAAQDQLEWRAAQMGVGEGPKLRSGIDPTEIVGIAKNLWQKLVNYVRSKFPALERINAFIEDEDGFIRFNKNVDSDDLADAARQGIEDLQQNRRGRDTAEDVSAGITGIGENFGNASFRAGEEFGRMFAAGETIGDSLKAGIKVFTDMLKGQTRRAIQGKRLYNRQAAKGDTTENALRELYDQVGIDATDDVIAEHIQTLESLIGVGKGASIAIDILENVQNMTLENITYPEVKNLRNTKLRQGYRPTKLGRMQIDASRTLDQIDDLIEGIQEAEAGYGRSSPQDPPDRKIRQALERLRQKYRQQTLKTDNMNIAELLAIEEIADHPFLKDMMNKRVERGLTGILRFDINILLEMISDVRAGEDFRGSLGPYNEADAADFMRVLNENPEAQALIASATNKVELYDLVDTWHAIYRRFARQQTRSGALDHPTITGLLSDIQTDLKDWAHERGARGALRQDRNSIRNWLNKLEKEQDKISIGFRDSVIKEFEKMTPQNFFDTFTDMDQNTIRSVLEMLGGRDDQAAKIPLDKREKPKDTMTDAELREILKRKGEGVRGKGKGRRWTPVEKLDILRTVLVDQLLEKTYTNRRNRPAGNNPEQVKDSALVYIHHIQELLDDIDLGPGGVSTGKGRLIFGDEIWDNLRNMKATKSLFHFLSTTQKLKWVRDVRLPMLGPLREILPFLRSTKHGRQFYRDVLSKSTADSPFPFEQFIKILFSGVAMKGGEAKIAGRTATRTRQNVEREQQHEQRPVPIAPITNTTQLFPEAR